MKFWQILVTLVIEKVPEIIRAIKGKKKGPKAPQQKEKQ